MTSISDDYRKDNTASYKTPVMAGGLFAMDKNFFFELGSYDEVHIYYSVIFDGQIFH